MASTVTFSISSPSSFTLSGKLYRPLFPQKLYRLFVPRKLYFQKPISVKASSTSLDYSTSSVLEKQPAPLKTGNWQWKFKDNFINIYYEEHERESSDPPKNILMIPTISDVSTVEEWRSVAKDIAQRDGKVNWRATIVDWPGLGYSDRPKMEYNADVMEKFVVDFINAPDSPVSSSGGQI